MSTDWVTLISPKVFSRIKSEFSQSIKTKYGMASKNFSTVGSSETPAVFPFVYVQTLPAVEQGRDLEGISINSGLFSFQIDVIDNQSQDRARVVMTEIIRIMKTMAFEITAIPCFENAKDVHRMTARFRRAIDKKDIL